MLGIGFQELVLILVVAIVVVGPKKLPDLAKSLGKGLQEFRKATDGLKGQLSDNETFKDLQGIKNSMQETVSSLKPSGLLDLDVTPTPAPAHPEPELKKFEAPTAAPEADATAAILEPKAPVENLEGRITVMDSIVGEHHQVSPEGAQPPAADQAEAPPAATEAQVASAAPASETASAPPAAPAEPSAQPSQTPKKTDA